MFLFYLLELWDRLNGSVRKVIGKVSSSPYLSKIKVITERLIALISGTAHKENKIGKLRHLLKAPVGSIPKAGLKRGGTNNGFIVGIDHWMCISFQK